jgi:hypothetical protein
MESGTVTVLLSGMLRRSLKLSFGASDEPSECVSRRLPLFCTMTTALL